MDLIRDIDILSNSRAEEAEIAAAAEAQAAEEIAARGKTVAEYLNDIQQDEAK